jgi:hypothetical protein
MENIKQQQEQGSPQSWQLSNGFNQSQKVLSLKGNNLRSFSSSKKFATMKEMKAKIN